MPAFEFNELLRDAISQKLAAFSRNACSDPALTQAAVVIGVCPLNDKDATGIILTRRSSKLRKHAGQFALPGGKIDAEEALIDASLRELREELGLTVCTTSVLGLLDDMPTQSGFNISPVVVWIDSLDQLSPNPDEVAEVYQIPLTELDSMNLTLGHEDSEDELSPAADTQTTANQNSASGNNVMSLHLPSVGTTVYSPTAAIIYQFREVAILDKATRVAHFGQPRFAWR